MRTKKVLLAFWLFLFTFSIAYAEDFSGDARRSSAASTSGQGHRSVVGTVSKTTQDMISLEMPEGTTRNFTVKDAAREGVTKLQPGDRILLEFDEGNQIIDIVNLGEKHQLIRGEVLGVDQEKKVITLKLKSGASQSYKMKEAMAGKMNNIKKGNVVTLMVDQHNNSAMDVHVD